jgi:hypothetical protein
LRMMERFAAPLERSIRANSLVRPGAQFEMLVSTFGGDAVALGSAIMPIEAMIAAEMGSNASPAG